MSVSYRMRALWSLHQLTEVALTRRQTARPPPRLRTRWTDAREAELREALRLQALLARARGTPPLSDGSMLGSRGAVLPVAALVAQLCACTASAGPTTFCVP